jgi:hypothetical protein
MFSFTNHLRNVLACAAEREAIAPFGPQERRAQRRTGLNLARIPRWYLNLRLVVMCQ